jgi:hypothetical protein
MVELPNKVTDYKKTPSQGEVQQNLYGGAVGVTRFPDALRTWSLTFPALGGTDLQVVNGFYRRAFGAGAWAFTPPEEINRLTYRQSMCGAAFGLVEGWAVTDGTLAISAAAARTPPCGVLRWTPTTTAKLLVPGTVVTGTPTPDIDRAPVTVDAEAVSSALWAKSASGTPTLTAILKSVAANGTVTSTVTGSAVTLNTSTWQQVGVTASAGALSSVGPYILPEWQNGGSSAAVDFTTPQLSYWSSHLTWEMGTGVPRVVWPAGAERDINGPLLATVTMTLAESITGAA